MLNLQSVQFPYQSLTMPRSPEKLSSFVWDNSSRTTPTWDMPTVMTRSLLDQVHDQLLEGRNDVHMAMADLSRGLWSIRSASTNEAWGAAIDQCVNHPVCELIHQDPFTMRSFQKPRGYAGDAVLIDYIYSRDCRLDQRDEVTPLGEQIFHFNQDTPACRAVRTRRDLMTGVIDQVCDSMDRPKILSVACGHLREAAQARSVREHRVGQFFALDQDELSIRLVEREASALGVTPVQDSIKGLFRGSLANEKFDLIYSMGLYDYLDNRVAAKLTHRMFNMLNPGGKLLVANFLPNLAGSSYMEAFMDWKLIYRSVDQLMATSSDIPESEIANRTTFVEENRNIVFMEMTRQ